MTQLEKEIYEAIRGVMRKDDDGDYCLMDGGELKEEAVPEVVKVAKKYIEKAYSAGAIQYGFKSLEGKSVSIEEMKTEWLKENSITE